MRATKYGQGNTDGIQGLSLSFATGSAMGGILRRVQSGMEYEPEGYVLPGGQCYLPDFLLHGCVGRSPANLYVEVKGNMTVDDANKIEQFVFGGGVDGYNFKFPVLIVTGIPYGNDMQDIDDFCIEKSYGFPEFPNGPSPFNYYTIDGDNYTAILGVDKNRRFGLFVADGDRNNYLDCRDDEATLRAFKLARQARFEHGEKPRA